jgi:hypothetical protein
MFKKLQLWAPLFVLLSLFMDMYINWADVAYRMLCITAMLGWLMYWDALNDLYKIQKETDINAQS